MRTVVIGDIHLDSKSRGHLNAQLATIESIIVDEQPDEIIFLGKKIMRETIVKEWDIPDIITEDIGYQLMFGNRPTINRKAPLSNVEELQIDINLK